MLCQNCHIREANVHFTKIVNGQTGVMHLCQECAQKMQGLSFGFHPAMISDFLKAIFESEASENIENKKETEERCPLCGMTLTKIQHYGKLGCSECYETFEPQLEILFKKIHGSGFHVGKVPSRGWSELRSKNELQHLKQKMQEAVQSEEFEEAAVLRDRIKELEKITGGEQDG